MRALSALKSSLAVPDHAHPCSATHVANSLLSKSVALVELLESRCSAALFRIIRKILRDHD
jgi:hypothetical protein